MNNSVGELFPSSNLFAFANGSKYSRPEKPVDVEQKPSRNAMQNASML